MIRIFAAVILGVLVSGQAVSPATSQIYTPPGGGVPVITPPSPPPPRIEVPAIPQMDAPPKSVRPAAPRDSFGDRVSKCLSDPAAAGLGPNERAAYSRACANQ